MQVRKDIDQTEENSGWYNPRIHLIQLYHLRFRALYVENASTIGEFYFFDTNILPSWSWTLSLTRFGSMLKDTLTSLCYIWFLFLILGLYYFRIVIGV